MLIVRARVDTNRDVDLFRHDSDGRAGLTLSYTD